MAPQREWLEKDYYAVLGVSKDATLDEIKKAYRKLARQYHPDSNKDPDAEKKFKEVGEAYAVVGNEQTRKEYDEIRRLGASGFAGVGAGGFPGGFNGAGAGDLGDLLRGLFEQGGAGSPFGGFAGSGRARAARPQKGRDLTADVSLSFEDALAGVRTKLRIRGDGACDTCNGSGAKPGTQPHACRQCGGSGQIAIDQGPFSIAQPCPTCGGSGRQIDDPCPTCSGTGRTIKTRELTVKVPAGVKDGATVRVPGRGGAGSNGGPAGDLLVRVHVEPHDLFGRRGDHVTLEVPVTFAEASLGTKLTVPTPDGGTATIKIPAGTPTGKTFRIRGKGATGRKGTGDLLVTVAVQVPDKLSKDQKRLVEELRGLDDTTDRDRRFGAARARA